MTPENNSKSVKDKELSEVTLKKVVEVVLSSFNKHWQGFETDKWSPVEFKAILDSDGNTYSISHIKDEMEEHLNINLKDQNGGIISNMHVFNDTRPHKHPYRFSDCIYASTRTNQKPNIIQNTSNTVIDLIKVMQICDLIKDPEVEQILEIIK